MADPIYLTHSWDGSADTTQNHFSSKFTLQFIIHKYISKYTHNRNQIYGLYVPST